MRLVTPPGIVSPARCPPERAGVPFCGGISLQRVIAYIDGFNLYYGIKSKGWRRYYWLNLQGLVLGLLKPNQTLQKINYFTTIVNTPRDKNRRQAAFLDALSTIPDLCMYYGHYLSDMVVCHRCGHTHATYHEKMTDVNMAVEMLCDAYQDKYDVALLISADSDLVPPIRAIQSLFPLKRIIVVFPPARHSGALQAVADATLHITANLLSRSQFPDQVVTAEGVIIQRPSTWR